MTKKYRFVSMLMVVPLLGSCGSGANDDDDGGGAGVSAAPSEATSPADSSPSDSSTPPDSAADLSDSEAGADGGTFRFATSTLTPTLDPSQAGSDTYLMYFWPVYETLIRADVNGNLVPGLADEWTLSEDGLTFDLSLRDGATFQDGSPVDADAVVANFEHSKAEGSLLAPLLTVIDTVEAVGETRVRFSLSRPGGDMPEILRGYAGMMASPAAIEAGTLATEPVGAGPFTLTSITDTTVAYERNPDYWDADAIHLDGMEISVMSDDIARLNALRSGQLDGTFIRTNQVAEAEASGLSTVSGLMVFTYGMYLNPATPEFSDPDVRRAIFKAIDRASIATNLYDDMCAPTAQLFPPEYWAHNDEIDDATLAAYEPEEAKALLQSAAADGLSFTLTIPAVTAYQRLAEVLQAQLGEIGVTVEVNALDASDAFARLRTGDYSALLTAFYAASPDPAAYAAQYYVTEPGGNEPLVPDLATQIEAARLTIDPDARATAIGQISATVLDAGTTTVPVCMPEFVLASSEKVSGLEVPLLANFDFSRVVMEG